MTFSAEEIKNLEALLTSPLEENIKIALAILGDGPYPTTIQTMLDDYKLIYNLIGTSPYETHLPTIRLAVHQITELRISSEAKSVGLLEKDLLSKISSLEELYLSGNDLSQVNFASLTNLKVLGISYCRLTQFPIGLEHLTSLQELSLGFERLGDEFSGEDNDFDQADFTLLNPLINLKNLSLVNCHLTQLPTGLDILSTLEVLDLDYNNLSQADLTPLLALHNLKYLGGIYAPQSRVLKILRDRGVHMYVP